VAVQQEDVKAAQASVEQAQSAVKAGLLKCSFRLGYLCIGTFNRRLCLLYRRLRRLHSGLAREGSRKEEITAAEAQYRQALAAVKEAQAGAGKVSAAVISSLRLPSRAISNFCDSALYLATAC
jgi:multidrug resistance efflux pump